MSTLSQILWDDDPADVKTFIEKLTAKEEKECAALVVRTEW